MRRTVFYLFAFALIVRVVTWLVRVAYGFNIGFPDSETFNDFVGVYLPGLQAITGGSILYKDVASSYPPLFTYSMLPFYLLGGTELAAFPMLLADAGTAVVIYLIAREISSHSLATAASLSYAISPFALYYEGYVWYSSQPMTFFILLVTYLAVNEKYAFSFWALGLAILFKQQAVFMLPILLAVVIIRRPQNVLKAVGGLLGILTAASFPFMAVAPGDYLALVSYGLLGTWRGGPVLTPQTSSALCVNILTNLQGTGLSCSISSLSYYQFVTNPSLADKLTYGLNFTAQLSVIPVFLALIPALITLRHWKGAIVIYSAYAGIGSEILFALTFHPDFKYYLLPVYALLFAVATSKKSLAVALGSSLVALFAPSGPFQLLLSLLAILFLVVLIGRESNFSGGQSDLMPMNQCAWPFCCLKENSMKA